MREVRYCEVTHFRYNTMFRNQCIREREWLHHESRDAPWSIRFKLMAQACKPQAGGFLCGAKRFAINAPKGGCTMVQPYNP